LYTQECRLLTLVGPGGSGKTRLALKVARGLIKDEDPMSFPDGLFFVPLAANTDIEGVVPTIAHAVGFSFYGEGEPQTQLLNYLKRRQLLLILDNFEHLVKDAGLIDKMLRTAPDIKVLVTSRMWLNLRPEHYIPVPGMDYPTETEDLDKVARHSAVKLFVQCARRVQPEFELDALNTADVVRVCKIVHGMPLGILMATAWLHMLSPGEIADEIERSLDFLETNWLAVPARQRSMRAVFEHSWRLLSEREREILCGLSVFRGGCTLEAVQAVTGASLRDLLGLINKSQLHRTSEGRYEMHELLHQYAAERLGQQTSNAIKVCGQHSKFYADNLARWKKQLKGPRQRVAVYEITADLANIHSAIDWMLDKAEISYLEDAIDALGIYYSMLHRHSEALTRWESIAKKTRAFTTEDGVRLRVLVLTWLTYLLRGIGNKTRALQTINESLSILGLSDIINDEFVEPEPSVSKADQRLWAFVYGAAGRCYYDIDIAKVRWLFEQSLSLYQGIGDDWSVARLLICLAEVMSETSKSSVDKIEPLIRESLAISQSLGDYWRLISNYQRLGNVLISTGRLEEGERYYHLAETTGIKVGDAISDMDIFHKHRVLIRFGKYNHALSDLKAEITRNEDRIVGGSLIEGNLLVSECYMNLGLYEMGYKLTMECLEYCLKTDFKRKGANCCWQLGLNSIALGRYSEAQRWLERSNSIFQEFGVSENCKIYIGLGFVAQSLRQKRKAMILFIQAIQMAVRQHNWEIMHHLLPGVALLLSDMNQHECAVEFYALACQHPYVVNSKWFEDVAGKHIAKVAESLPPEVVSAAQERGRKRDLWETAEELLTELSDDKITA
jgi:predicted ATPase